MDAIIEVGWMPEHMKMCENGNTRYFFSFAVVFSIRPVPL
jgi:hypothetical protein